jgi:RNA-splicing ligase RtcB
MRLLKSHLKPEQLSRSGWNSVANAIRLQKGTLGDLGGGNHFLVALSSYSANILYFLIHTGSRSESGLVDNLTERPKEFDLEFERIVEWAQQNRATIQKNLENEFAKMELVLDLPHNTFEIIEDGGIVIRKGAVKLKPNELSIIPSHMSGDAVLVQGTEKMKDIILSMSHGTGRKMSRSESKKLANESSFAKIRQDVLFPDGIEDASLRTEGPYAYRELESCLNLLTNYVEEVERFRVIGYMGHL